MTDRSDRRRRTASPRGARARRTPGPRRLLEPLAPPIIWMVAFFVVYLVAETACSSGSFDVRALGLTGTSLVTVVVTGAALLATTWFAVRAWRRRHEPADSAGIAEQSRMLDVVGGLLGALFLIATVALGLPAIVLTPC